MEGYQKLEQKFFGLCNDRGIRNTSMLLLIYLRGMYCKYGNGFYVSDNIICEDLQISDTRLTQLKQILKEKGLLLYKSGNGRGNSTTYTLLESFALPPKKVQLSCTFNREKLYLSPGKVVPSNNTIKEQVKKQVIGSTNTHRQKEQMPISCREDLRKMGFNV